MKEGLKIYRVEFEGIWPVGNCLILVANTDDDAFTLASRTLADSGIYRFTFEEIVLSGDPQVIEYLSGDY